MKYSAPMFSSFSQCLAEFMLIAIKHDFVMHLHSQGPLARLKTSGCALGFQHFPRDLVNVNEWKIMCDPSNMFELTSI